MEGITDKLHLIVLAPSVERLKEYCDEKNGRIERCFSYERNYCPKTCWYAKRRLRDE